MKMKNLKNRPIVPLLSIFIPKDLEFLHQFWFGFKKFLPILISWNLIKKKKIDRPSPSLVNHFPNENSGRWNAKHAEWVEVDSVIFSSEVQNLVESRPCRIKMWNVPSVHCILSETEKKEIFVIKALKILWWIWHEMFRRKKKMYLEQAWYLWS